MRKGLFVVVEGFDGAGKSTFCRTLEHALKQQGVKTKLVRQPGGTPMAERLRDLLKDPEVGESIPALSEYLMMSAARHQLWVNVIQPALEEDYVVICDRHILSSTAYQGCNIVEVDQAVAGSSDFTVFLDVDFQVAMTRLAEKNEACRIEQKGGDYLKVVYDRYVAAWALLPPNRRLWVGASDFDSHVYRLSVQNVINAVLKSCGKGPVITAQEFERQVLEVEGVRIIIKQDGNLPLPRYPFPKLRDPDPTLSQRRIASVLQNIPYVIVPVRDETNAIPQ